MNLNISKSQNIFGSNLDQIYLSPDGVAFSKQLCSLLTKPCTPVQ
jgi:hypothetical protein